MADNDISIKLFDKFNDSLRNYDGKIEVAEGIFWNRLTEAQRFFMINLKTTKVDYPIFLFSGQENYQIPEWILEIKEAELRDSTDTVISPHFTNVSYPQLSGNLYVEFPRTTTAGYRYAKIVIPDDTIQLGWKLMTKAYLRPLSTDVIDRQHAPIIESDFHDLLVDYVLSFYRVKIIDNKQVVNPNFKDLKMVLQEADYIRNNMYGLDGVSILHPGGWF